MRKIGYGIIAAIVLGVGCVLAPSGRAETPDGASDGAALPRERLLVVGRVARSALKHKPRVEVFADWLAGRLKEAGIDGARAVIARSPTEMAEWLRTGAVDLVEETVLAALSYEDRAGASVIALAWRNGRPYYKSVFVTQDKRDVYSLRDLEGLRLAFEDAGSTTGFLAPLAMLILDGLKPIELSSVQSPVPPGRVGYVFARSEENISAWVANGIVDAGAYSERDWERKKTTPERFRKKMRILAMSGPLPRSTLVARKGLPQDVLARISKALSEYETAPDAASVRDRFYKVSRFAPVDSRIARELDEARELYRLVRPFIR